jgi:hypothetical protein
VNTAVCQKIKYYHCFGGNCCLLLTLVPPRHSIFSSFQCCTQKNGDYCERLKSVAFVKPVPFHMFYFRYLVQWGGKQLCTHIYSYCSLITGDSLYLQVLILLWGHEEWFWTSLVVSPTLAMTVFLSCSLCIYILLQHISKRGLACSNNNDHAAYKYW